MPTSFCWNRFIFDTFFETRCNYYCHYFIIIVVVVVVVHGRRKQIKSGEHVAPENFYAPTFLSATFSLRMRNKACYWLECFLVHPRKTLLCLCYNWMYRFFITCNSVHCRYLLIVQCSLFFPFVRKFFQQFSDRKYFTLSWFFCPKIIFKLRMVNFSMYIN